MNIHAEHVNVVLAYLVLGFVVFVAGIGHKRSMLGFIQKYLEIKSNAQILALTRLITADKLLKSMHFFTLFFAQKSL